MSQPRITEKVRFREIGVDPRSFAANPHPAIPWVSFSQSLMDW